MINYFCDISEIEKNASEQLGLFEKMGIDNISVFPDIHYCSEKNLPVGVAICLIGAFVGWMNCFNEQDIHDGSKKCTPMEGYNHLKTKKDPYYKYVWKNDKGEIERFKEVHEFEI